MDWSANTTHQIRQSRAKMLHDIRAFFYERKVLEVETPALSLAGNTDPFIQSIHFTDAQIDRYLHTSPEYPMKRLLASGSGDIYQICKVWIEGESGHNHNPEFTLLEWYRVGFSYQQLMQEVIQLLEQLIPTLKTKQKKYTYEQLFLEKFDINPHIASKEQVENCVNKNITGLATDTLSKQASLDALLTHCIEPDFDNDCLTLVYDYPTSQSALAQIKEQVTYPVAERFEIYKGAIELGNGYQEEVNYQRNKQILESENISRSKLNIDTVTQDNRFLEACKAGIPRSAGVAIGLDRILMCVCDEKNIQKVINFPWDKA